MNVIKTIECKSLENCLGSIIELTSEFSLNEYRIIFLDTFLSLIKLKYSRNSKLTITFFKELNKIESICDYIIDFDAFMNSSGRPIVEQWEIETTEQSIIIKIIKEV